MYIPPSVLIIIVVVLVFGGLYAWWKIFNDAFDKGCAHQKENDDEFLERQLKVDFGNLEAIYRQADGDFSAATFLAVCKKMRLSGDYADSLGSRIASDAHAILNVPKTAAHLDSLQVMADGLGVVYDHESVQMAIAAGTATAGFLEGTHVDEPSE